MSKKASATLIGAFVLGGLVLAVAGIVVFGGGRLLTKKLHYVAYFEEPITGLATGAPVSFKGVRVGTVKGIIVLLDMENKQCAETAGAPAAQNAKPPPAPQSQDHTSPCIWTQVTVELEPGKVTDVHGTSLSSTESARQIMSRLVAESGLRAQLELQSFLTGQLMIQLDLHPGTEPVYHSTQSLAELPTIPSTVASVSEAFENVDLKQLVSRTQATLQDIEQALGRLDMGQTMESLGRMIQYLEGLSRTANEQLGPSLEVLNSTMQRINKLAERLDGQVEPVTSAFRAATAEVGALARQSREETIPALRNEVQGTLRKIGDSVAAAEKEIKTVRQDVSESLQYLENQVEIAKRKLEPLGSQLPAMSGAAAKTLENAKLLLAELERMLAEGSTLRQSVDEALRGVSDASRSVRLMADYIERHPEALLHGKPNAGEWNE